MADITGRRVVPSNVCYQAPPLNRQNGLADMCWDGEDLRETLLAHDHYGRNGQPLQRMEHQHSHGSIHSHDQNIDPAIAGPGIMNTNTGDSGGDGNQSDSKKGKRELSTSKRAAQNRAAQVRLLFP